MNVVHVVNGPNLNLLGLRDARHYGTSTLEEVRSLVEEAAGGAGVELRWSQSNSEGEVITLVQSVIGDGDGLVINPGALTHYSYALADALDAVEVPKVEVHLSNTAAREEFRHKSVVSPVVDGTITGLGPAGYVLAVDAVLRLIEARRSAS